MLISCKICSQTRFVEGLAMFHFLTFSTLFYIVLSSHISFIFLTFSRLVHRIDCKKQHVIKQERIKGEGAGGAPWGGGTPI